MSLGADHVRVGPSLNKEFQFGPPFSYLEYQAGVTAVALGTITVGSANYAAEPSRMPQFFIAKKVTIRCTQACWIRFNNQRAAPIWIPANTFMVFDTPTSVLYYQQDTVSGTLRVWLQG